MSPRPLPDARRTPLATRFGPDAPRYAETITAHERAVDAGEAGYLDPVSGLFVFTARYHWERGRCCESGCRHCPFAAGERRPQPRP